MKRTISHIQASLAKALNAMPGVFSTVQWGGRAYKLPGPGSRGRRKPVLLTHTYINKAEDAVCLGFRLEKSRARAVVREFEWIQPSSFGNLSKSGWVQTQVRTKSQCKVIIRLLKESRTLHPMPEAGGTVEESRRGNATRPRRGKRSASASAAADPVARRIDSVLRLKREQGWRPATDAFD